MKNLKRVLALVTVLSMLMSVSAFAADGDEGEEEPEAVVVVISTNEESTEDDKSVTIPAEDDNGAAVMEAIEDIHDAIDNAADGSTVTITVGDGAGTLVNDGEGVLEDYIEYRYKNEAAPYAMPILELTKELDTLEAEFLMGEKSRDRVEAALNENETVGQIASTFNMPKDTLINNALYDFPKESLGENELQYFEAMAAGYMHGFIVGENILTAPAGETATVTVNVDGTLSSTNKYNNTIAAGTILKYDYPEVSRKLVPQDSHQKGGTLIIDSKDGVFTADARFVP